MNMASSDLRRRAVRPEPPAVKLERIPSVPADATVRHVDQFETGTLDVIYHAVAENRPIPAAETGLEPGEVLVFTDYYRVERA
ncbi:hypothetical protein A6E15_01805 [Natrinema saccharevitans]|uniref:Uncharacterized protein n=1 Tax=Natrinema saccharevitans TaxID=301967 RepID=A0A1S8ASX4_9EURY|nr:hypothetical protein [Natrinema saccharevitans]OLZ39792.1 hypothetical protein A6E15_01805 [Natrinema saccharevitans]